MLAPVGGATSCATTIPVCKLIQLATLIEMQIRHHFHCLRSLSSVSRRSQNKHNQIHEIRCFLSGEIELQIRANGTLILLFILAPTVCVCQRSQNRSSSIEFDASILRLNILSPKTRPAILLSKPAIVSHREGVRNQAEVYKYNFIPLVGQQRG